MSTFKFWGESQSGEEEVSCRLREDGSYEVTYRKGKRFTPKSFRDLRQDLLIIASASKRKVLWLEVSSEKAKDSRLSKCLI